MLRHVPNRISSFFHPVEMVYLIPTSSAVLMSNISSLSNTVKS